MPLTSAEFQSILSVVSQMIQAQPTHKAEHGVTVTGTWAATDAPPRQYSNTCQVTPGKVAAIQGYEDDPVDPDYGFSRERVDILSPAIGLQYAPRGGERTLIIATEVDPVCQFLHAQDVADTSLKPGELSLRHFTGGTAFDIDQPAPHADVTIKLANDGVTTGDNLGSLLIVAGALLRLATTSDSVTITATDSSGALQIGATTIQLAGSVTAAGNGVMNATDTQNALTAFKAAMVTAGVTNAGAIVVPTVTGSSKTFTA